MADPIRVRLTQALAGRYEVEDEVGRGGMATVYRAHDVKHQRMVAIKVLQPELARVIGGERFLREITIAARLQSPHILPLLDSGEADGLLYYVMPFVTGESLRDLLARDGALPVSDALRLLREIVDGLAHAHRHGVMHRDIKPDNVLIAERHAMLVDFGVAKALAQGVRAAEPGDAAAAATLTEVGMSLGTPAYMAPEQAMADPALDHRADLYAVGVLAYEMLTGAPPFSGTAQSVIADHLAKDPPPIVRPDVPPAVKAIVMRCLAKQPAARFQTADDLLGAIEPLVTPVGTVAAMPPAARRRRVLVGAAVAVAVAALGYAGVRRTQQRRWVHETAIPEARRMIEAGERDSAFYLATAAARIAPHDSALRNLWPGFTARVDLVTAPAGVRVWRASFPDTSAWHELGTTPLDSFRLPDQIGLFRFEKPGYRTSYNLIWDSPDSVLLDPLDDPDSDMVRIPGGRYRAFLVGADAAPRIVLRGFRMNRYEISNRQYRAFVDAGGYRDTTWWTEPFRDNGRVLTRREAMARFVDQTGRPGPATWVAGSYPDGQADMPVGGVSWYEAAAFANYAGKSLPTAYHWAEAARVYLARRVVPESNLGGEGPWPVGRPRAVSHAGVSDLAGNVREWCLNEAGGGQRFILGGGWSDPTYSFTDAYAQPPMDRSPINGIRLVRYDAADPNLAQAEGPMPRAFTDYDAQTPVSDAEFAGFRAQFDYDPQPLDARIERSDTTDEWVAQYVTFRAAYHAERMAAWVFLPRHATPPWQTVVFFPGSGALNSRSSARRRDMTASFVVPSGRVFVLPIYKSTYERGDSLTSDIPDRSIFWRDHVVMWVKDYRRTLDYLSTRPDIDTTRFAYFGYSWGGNMGGIIPAVEPRLKAVVLYVAGFTMERPRPEVDPLNYLPRIHQPVLMLNGKYDFFFPTETAQRPFFRRLGTAAAEKRYVVYEGGHDVPRPQLIAESLAWLDRFLGAVRR